MPPRFSAYVEASRAVFRVFEDAAPVVEGLSIDEAFLDVHGMERSVGTPVEIAGGCGAQVRERVGLPITVGVARTKFLAKVASAVAKPDGLLVVPPDGELEFLHPLPVERLWGVGPVTARKLHDRGITTVRQVALPPRAGPRRACSGRRAAATCTPSRTTAIPDPCSTAAGDGSIGSQRARGRRPWTRESLDADLVGLVDRVTRRMRAADRVGRTVVLRLRFDDYTRATRSHTLRRPTAGTLEILTAARELLAASLPLLRSAGLTLVGISVTNLDDDEAVQLVLPFDGDRQAALDAALDDVRDRFGSAAVTRAVLLGRDPGLTMPMLPD